MSGLPGLATLEVPRRASTTMDQDGAAAVIKSPDASVNGSELTLSPGSGGIAFAIYRFDSGFSSVYDWIEITCSGGSDVYLAVSNYETMTWEFHGKLPAQGAMSWDLTTQPGLYSNGTSTYVAVVAYGVGFSVQSVSLRTPDPLVPAYQHLFGAAGTDNIQQITAGPNGSFYMVGSLAANGGATSKVLVMRGNPDGTLAWARQWGSDATNQAATDCAVDGSGALYVCATVTDATDSDVAVLLFAPDGMLLQQVQWAETARFFSDDVPEAIRVVNANGDVVVAGYCGDQGTFSNETEHSLLLLRFTSNLELQTATYWDPDDPQLSTEGLALDVDGGGNSYVIGSVYQPIGLPAPPRRCGLVRFNAAGGVDAQTMLEDERLAVPRDIVYNADNSRLIISYSDDVAGDWHEALLEVSPASLAQTGGISFWGGTFQYAEDLQRAADGSFWLCGYGPAPASIIHVGADLTHIAGYAMQPPSSGWEPLCLLPTGSGQLIVAGNAEDLVPQSISLLTLQTQSLPGFNVTTAVATTSGTPGGTATATFEDASDAMGNLDTPEPFNGQASWLGYSLP